MASSIYQCPECGERFFGSAATPRSRLICPHCSFSDSAETFPQQEENTPAEKRSVGAKARVRLPERKTGMSHRSRREDEDPAAGQSPPVSPPPAEGLLRSLLEPDSPAAPQPPLRPSPTPPVRPAPAATPAPGPSAKPPQASRAPFRPDSIHPPSPQPASPSQPAPAKAAGAAPELSPEQIDADFELHIVESSSPLADPSRHFDPEALLPFEPWEGQAPGPDHGKRRLTLVLIASAAALLAAGAAFALLQALR